MGLDIGTGFDNSDELFNNPDFSQTSSSTRLSRTFCQFILSKDVIHLEETILYQLGELTGVDIDFLYSMAEYTPEYEVQETLSRYEDGELRAQIEAKFREENQPSENNLGLVIERLGLLIDQLSGIPHLENHLNKSASSAIDVEYYCSRFNEDIGDGYIDNNLGHDLRNLLKIAKSGYKHGAKTMYFHFG